MVVMDERLQVVLAADLTRPSLIRVHTVIGYGAPHKQGKSSVHGAALGEEELKAAKENLGWPLEPRFLVPDDVRALWAEVIRGKKAEHEAWTRRAEAWRPWRAPVIIAGVSGIFRVARASTSVTIARHFGSIAPRSGATPAATSR